MDYPDSEWRIKGATLSDKSAREEFALTEDEIVQAIRDGALHYREASMHGTRGCGFSGGRWRRWFGRSTALST